MKKLLPLMGLVLLIVSCSRSKVFEKYTPIENYIWKRDHVIRFEVPVQDTANAYDVELAVRHTTYYPYANILVNVCTTDPEGNLRTRDFNIRIRNTDGSFIGEGAGDLWDISQTVLNQASFKIPGVYVFEVQNVMPYIEIPDIMDVGLIVRKTEKSTVKGDQNQ